mmetsp:Transcript_5992/g.10847  ORF Transcript_5992/g.10847 Transcript_5992/m.10847 type:complete len:96 (-) Transcript_5992:722-1009(-)
MPPQTLRMDEVPPLLVFLNLSRAGGAVPSHLKGKAGSWQPPRREVWSWLGPDGAQGDLQGLAHSLQARFSGAGFPVGGHCRQVPWSRSGSVTVQL